MKRLPEQISTSQLRESGVHTIRTVMAQIQENVQNDTSQTLAPVVVNGVKQALRLDVIAEDAAASHLRKQARRHGFREIGFYGEERLQDPTLDLSSARGTQALVDMGANFRMKNTAIVLR